MFDCQPNLRIEQHNGGGYSQVQEFETSACVSLPNTFEHDLDVSMRLRLILIPVLLPKRFSEISNTTMSQLISAQYSNLPKLGTL
jgi:hypothetical protein